MEKCFTPQLSWSQRLCCVCADPPAAASSCRPALLLPISLVNHKSPSDCCVAVTSFHRRLINALTSSKSIISVSQHADANQDVTRTEIHQNRRMVFCRRLKIKSLASVFMTVGGEKIAKAARTRHASVTHSESHSSVWVFSGQSPSWIRRVL